MVTKFQGSLATLEERSGFFNKTGDFLQYGLADSAISAGLSFANTGIALGNAFGADMEQLDTEDTINDMLGEDYATYYRDNSDLVDTVGLVAGSFIPGLAGVKLARAATMGTLATKTSRLATAIRETMIPQARIAAARNVVLKQNLQGTFDGVKRALLAKNMGQNFAESAIYEAATLLTMNQSTALNKDQVGYFDAIATNLDTAAFGVVFGGLVGGGLGYLGDRGTFERQLVAWQRDPDIVKASRTFSSGANTLPGDEATLAINELNTNRSRLADINAGRVDGELAKAEASLLTNSIQATEARVTGILNKASKGHTYGTYFVDAIKQNNPEANIAESIGGLAKFGPLELAEKAPKKSLLKLGIFKEKAPEAAGVNYDFLDFPDTLKGKYTDLTIFPEKGMTQLNADIDKMLLEGVDPGDLYRESLAFQDAHRIAALWKTNTVRVGLKDVNGKLVRQANGKKVTAPLKLRQELEDFLDEFDPVYKENLFRYKNAFEAGEAGVEELARAEAKMYELASPNSMFGAAYRILNKADLDEGVKASIVKDGRFKTFYQWMDNNKALRHKYGSREAYIKVKTGQAVNKHPVAGISDLGPVKIRGNQVSAGRTSVTVKPGTFSTALKTHEQSAQYAWAESLFGGKQVVAPSGKLNAKVAENLAADDLPTLTATLRHYDFINGPVNVKTKKGVETIGSPFQMEQFITRQKKRIVFEQNALGEKAPSVDELVHMVDADEEWIQAVLTGTPDADKLGAKFKTKSENWSMTKEGIEEFKPSYFTAHYDVATFDQYGNRGWGLADIERRVQAQLQMNRDTAAAIFGDNAHLFDQGAVGATKTETYADNATVMDKTSSYLTSSESDYFSAGSVNARLGNAIDHTHQRAVEIIDSEAKVAASALSRNPEAQMELSVLAQSVLRSGQYKFMEDPVLAIGDNIRATLKAGGIDIDTMIRDRFMTANRLDNASRVILDAKLQSNLNAKISSTFADAEQWFPTKLADLESAIGIAMTKGDDAPLKSVSAAIRNYLEGSIDGWTDLVQATTSKSIHQIKTGEAADALRTYHKLNKKYLVDNYNLLMQTEGAGSAIDPDILYPGKFNAKRFPHVAFVKAKNEMYDPWAAKGRGMLVAHSDEALQAKIAQFRQQFGSDEVEILTNKQKEEWLKAAKQYDAELAVTDNFIDSSMRNEGKLWDMAPEPNPQEFAEMLGTLKNQYKNVLRRAVKLQNSQAVQTYEQLSRTYFLSGSVGKAGELDPFKKQINQMLAIPQGAEHTWWSTIQEVADMALSKQYHALRGAFIQAETSGDWEKFVKITNNYGLPQLIKGQEDWLLANASAPKPILGRLVAKTNGILATMMLRLDSAQGIINAMAMPVMQVPELQKLVQSFGRMTPEQAKRFDLILSAPLNGQGLRAPSNTKLLFQSAKNFHTKPELLKEYVDRGMVTGILHDIRQAMDDVAIIPGDVGKWERGLDKAVNLLAKPADFSEQWCKFMAADTARQVLDLAGVPKTNQLYWSTIKTFVNNVTGNYHISQRPGMFQGWAGQAIGLFQTYQFNLMQRFFRHVSDGGVAAKAMVGLQAGIFGAQSVPGFQLLNQHIGERTMGEKDFYSVTSESLDSPVAEFLLYGAGSSLTKPLVGGKGIDFFTRGDLTPRTPILIPTSFEDIPAVSFVSKNLTNIYNALSVAAGGGDAGTAFLNALANNSANRPIAGIAQMAQGYRTTSQGNLILTYPEIGWATRIAKSMGTRTMDESIAVNSYYRSLGYRAHRMAELESLGATFKSQIRSEDGASPEDLQEVMSKFVQKGGRMETFNRWMMNQYSNATESTVNKMRDKLKTQEGRYLQSVMGAPLTDEYNYIPSEQTQADELQGGFE